jgi:hypothetical protein
MQISFLEMKKNCNLNESDGLVSRAISRVVSEVNETISSGRVISGDISGVNETISSVTVISGDISGVNETVSSGTVIGGVEMKGGEKDGVQCSTEGCTNKIHAKGVCQIHYQIARRKLIADGKNQSKDDQIKNLKLEVQKIKEEYKSELSKLKEEIEVKNKKIEQLENDIKNKYELKTTFQSEDDDSLNFDNLDVEISNILESNLKTNGVFDNKETFENYCNQHKNKTYFGVPWFFLTDKFASILKLEEEINEEKSKKSNIKKSPNEENKKRFRTTIVRFIRFVSDNIFGPETNERFHQDVMENNKKNKITPKDTPTGQKYCKLNFELIQMFSTGVILKFIQFYKETKTVSTWRNEILGVKFILKRFKPFIMNIPSFERTMEKLDRLGSISKNLLKLEPNDNVETRLNNGSVLTSEEYNVFNQWLLNKIEEDVKFIDESEEFDWEDIKDIQDHIVCLSALETFGVRKQVIYNWNTDSFVEEKIGDTVIYGFKLGVEKIGVRNQDYFPISNLLFKILKKWEKVVNLIRSPDLEIKFMWFNKSLNKYPDNKFHEAIQRVFHKFNSYLKLGFLDIRRNTITAFYKNEDKFEPGEFIKNEKIVSQYLATSTEVMRGYYNRNRAILENVSARNVLQKISRSEELINSSIELEKSIEIEDNSKEFVIKRYVRLHLSEKENSEAFKKWKEERKKDKDIESGKKRKLKDMEEEENLPIQNEKRTKKAKVNLSDNNDDDDDDDDDDEIIPNQKEKRIKKSQEVYEEVQDDQDDYEEFNFKLN